MASLSNNTTLKVSAAIFATTTTNGATLYTAPANGYAILNVSLQQNASLVGQYCELRIGGRSVLTMRTQASGQVIASNSNGTNTSSLPVDGIDGQFIATDKGIYLGPGQSITFHQSSVSTRGTVSGVAFVNTP